ncbi:Aspartokinase [Hanseniaspora osmophila]|uniref:Aspartokinase n=1 Tax=Hanseniaspora osmophila TaxID=56408 RepID=A0A1E5RAR4_9ASCO|nr:Aspartokinase [Hanseniaspora osmophila]
MASETDSNWVIQKFGGTSVGKFSEQIVNEIIKVYTTKYSNKVAVVCSARSSYTKAEGTTSRLLSAADLSANEDAELKDVVAILDLVRNDHVENAKTLIKNKALQEKLIDDTNKEVDLVEKYINASQTLGEVSSRTMDLIMSCGEKLSCLFIASLCNDNGLKAQYVDLSHIIPSDYSLGDNKSQLDSSFYTFLTMALKEKLQPIVDANSKGETVVPVITGYFGQVPYGLLNSVGRGYTDLCAALVAVALNADELQVWKEVDGIFTADPRKVPEARLLPSVTPDEAAELTYYGSEVIHPFTMEQVIRARIPIRIKNVQNPTGEGTIIYPDNLGRKGELTPPHPPTLMTQSFYESASSTKRSATAITSKNDIVVLNIHSNKKTLSHGFLAQIFSILDKFKLVVDLISTSEVHVSMALPIPDTINSKNLKRAVTELKILGTVDVLKNMSIISLVGKQMKQFIGIAGTMFTTLAESGINIEMISQGANEINISCVIEKEDTIKALQSIHSKLLSLNQGNTPSHEGTPINERLEQIKNLSL